MSDSGTPLDYCLEEVIQVATDVMSAEDGSVPLLLLGLGKVLGCKELDSRGVREVKNQIWRCDLVHVIIEVLRQDFSCVQGQWMTATELAAILVTICAGFNPGARKKGLKFSSQSQGARPVPDEQIQEYYDILLPTAVDSVLFLANSLLELESVDAAAQGSHLVQFQSVLGSLDSLCTSHRQCLLRTLQSPYLLHILITDTADFYRVFLYTLTKLIQADPAAVSSLPESILHSILDELVYKISGKEKQLGKLSLETLAIFTTCCPDVIGVVVHRYKGLLTVVSQWMTEDADVNVKQLIGELEARSGTRRGMEKVNDAAVRIQATWRGYSARKKIHRMHKGIQRFQKLYRRRKAEKLRRIDRELSTRETEESKQVRLQSDIRDFHEKQMKTIQQLPAAQVDAFVHKQENEAATRIQSWWRRKTAQKEYLQRQASAQRNTSALVLQRSFRRVLARRRHEVSGNNAASLPRVSPAEREFFQTEIAKRRELHPTGEMSELQSRKLHNEAQDLLEEFYAARPAEQRKEEKGALLLFKLAHDCDLLLGAPGLEDATPEIMDSFSSRSASVARMAETAHREELEALERPWWKNPLRDAEQLS